MKLSNKTLSKLIKGACYFETKDNWDRFILCINKIKDTCAKYECIRLVDGFTLVPNVEECFSDKAHPNCFGSLMYSSNLIKAIRKLKF